LLLEITWLKKKKKKKKHIFPCYQTQKYTQSLEFDHMSEGVTDWSPLIGVGSLEGTIF
jgi:hypothetical protein